MYCRVCDKIRQDKNGCIYCSVDSKPVGLNQVCNKRFDIPNFDSKVLNDCGYIDLHDNIRVDIKVKEGNYQLFSVRGNLNVVSCDFNKQLKTTIYNRDNVEIMTSTREE